MTGRRFFCAAAARERGESLFGTAPQIYNWLLLEHPAAWSAKAFPDERLAPEIRVHLAHLSKQLPQSRRLMIRQCHSRRAAVQFFAIRSTPEERRVFYRDFEDYADLAAVSAEMISAESVPYPLNEPLFLVCTHGKHDQCCAKFGFSTFGALREEMDVAAWECSHVGGDRFAGNVILLPEGIYYGHVLAEHVSDLVASYRAGSILLPHFRGRSCYPRAVQAGEYYIRVESGITAIDGLRFVDSVETEEGRWRVRFRSRDSGRMHLADLRRVQHADEALLTCKSVAPQAVRGFALLRYSVDPEKSGG